ncbi:MAG: MOSC domain-containing protein [Flavobacteriaceae bacterium]
MKIISTNLGNPTTFIWNGKEEQTGIFKYPVNEPLLLRKLDVGKDTIINRINHGGVNKACYLFSADQYPYWKTLYPNLDWNWGMFGENLTVEGLNESELRVGDIYKVGKALVQVSQPREPCYKLGIRFGDQNILKHYIEHRYPGTYVKVLEEGTVQQGDVFHLIEQSANPLTVNQFYDLMFAKEKDQETLQLFMSNASVPAYKKERMKKYVL